MIKSISAWAFDAKRSASEVFALARQHGFDGVEVTIGEVGANSSRQVSFDSSREDCRRVREEAEKAGVQIVSLAAGWGWQMPLLSDNDELHQSALQAARDTLRVTRDLGLDAMLLVPGSIGADALPNGSHTPYDRAYQNAQRGLKQLAPIAEEFDVTIGVENVWNKFLLSPLEFARFLDEVNSPRVGCYFDVGNVLQSGFPEDWISILGSYISRIHFKDWQRGVGTIRGFCPLLEGDVNFPAVMQSLRDIGYDGAVTAEFFGCEADLPAISRAMDTILAM